MPRYRARRCVEIRGRNSAGRRGRSAGVKLRALTAEAVAPRGARRQRNPRWRNTASHAVAGAGSSVAQAGAFLHAVIAHRQPVERRLEHQQPFSYIALHGAATTNPCARRTKWIATIAAPPPPPGDHRVGVIVVSSRRRSIPTWSAQIRRAPRGRLISRNTRRLADAGRIALVSGPRSSWRRTRQRLRVNARRPAASSRRREALVAGAAAPACSLWALRAQLPARGPPIDLSRQADNRRHGQSVDIDDLVERSCSRRRQRARYDAATRRRELRPADPSRAWRIVHDGRLFDRP